jgi:endoglucanase
MSRNTVLQRLLVCWLLLLLTGCRLRTPSEPAPPAQAAVGPTQDLAGVERPAVRASSAALPGFSRGINLGNGLDAPSEGAWGVTLGERHFQMARAAKLDHVRLPVRFSAHAGHDAPFTIEEAFFARVDWAIQQALANGLSVIVDLHHYGELMKEPDRHADRFVELWRQIAARYRTQPEQVVFELLNEPSEALDPKRWNALLARAVTAVRDSNPTRVLIIDSYFWASAEYLDELELPQDPNLVASFHMYQPILFTHQGADWMGPEYQTRGVVFPGPPAVPIEPVPAASSVGWVKAWFDGYNHLPLRDNPGGPKTVFDHFRAVEDYIQQSGRRVYLGEFAAVDSADAKSRENYVRLVRQEAERRGIGWAYWDDGGKNRAMNVSSGDWVPFLKSALLD